MKKILVLMGLMVASCFAYEVDVTTDSIVILPSRSVMNPPAWQATNSYVNGQYATLPLGKAMCLVAGTSGATAPTTNGETVSDGTVTWVMIRSGERNSAVVTKNVSNSDLHVNLGSDATTTSGWVLYDKSSFFAITASDEYNGEISAISASGTNTVLVGDK